MAKGKRGHGQIRRSQVIMTWGPGALLDLPNHSVIVGGLDTWPKVSELDEITEIRLSQKLELMTAVKAPRLYNPPAASQQPWETPVGIGVWRFPEWFVVQEKQDSGGRERSRRLVHRKALDEKRRFDGLDVVPTRFVRGCPRGHVEDLNWHWFVHDGSADCKRQLWLDERGTSGDLGDLMVRCECGQARWMQVAADLEAHALGTCYGSRPWLGPHAGEECNQPSRLLIRTASNAYFSQAVSVLSLPDRGTAVQTVVSELWDDLQIVKDLDGLRFIKQKPNVAAKLAEFSDKEVLAAIEAKRSGTDAERPVKLVELEAMLASPEGFGDDVPIDPNFHARRLPDHSWRSSGHIKGVRAVIQLHRLREVVALAGFTRFEAETPDIHGEYASDVQRAQIAIEPQWFPAIENRGEGFFVQLDPDAVAAWMERPAVKRRLDQLKLGHDRWKEQRKSKREFPGGPYILLHTLSHLLIESVSMRCGYPASSIRERIYSEGPESGYGILLYTGTPDAEGTLGGLVQEARHLESHLEHAFRNGALCSNDPICAQHAPGESLESRWLHGAACHACALVAETSCEMRNDYLDRALVVPSLGVADAAFFGPHE